jgi:hypothetical protein
MMGMADVWVHAQSEMRMADGWVHVHREGVRMADEWDPHGTMGKMVFLPST